MKLSKEKLIPLVLGLIIYLLSAGFSYAAFSLLRPGLPTSEVSPDQPKTTGGKFQPPKQKYAGLPKTEECPLNGTLRSKPERELWEKRRPLGITVENSTAARPQSGLSYADIIYEAVAEGGITRFLAVYYCQDSDVVGPVRSARTYFLDWISEYGRSPLYAHVGGANTPGPADAISQIDRYRWTAFNDLNQFSIGFPNFWRDYERLGENTATEHTVYTSTSKLWDFSAKKRGLTSVEVDDLTGKEIAWNSTFIPWKFKDDVSTDKRPAKFAAEFSLSNTQASYIDDYLVRWSYDKTSNSYLRFHKNTEHRDMNTGAQILAKNVVILFTTMTVADDGYNEEGHGAHLLYGTKGTGKAKFLLDGQVVDGTWAKKSRVDRTIFYDASGVEVKFNRGLIWVEVLPIGQKITTS